MKTILFGIVLALLLSSCGPSIGSNFWFHGASLEERVTYYKKVCKAYGYRDGTSNMTECISTEIRNKRIETDKGFDDMKRSLERAGSSNRVTCQTYGTITNCRKY